MPAATPSRPAASPLRPRSVAATTGTARYGSTALAATAAAMSCGTRPSTVAAAALAAPQVSTTSASRARVPTTRCQPATTPIAAATAISPTHSSELNERVVTRDRQATSTSSTYRAATVVRRLPNNGRSTERARRPGPSEPVSRAGSGAGGTVRRSWSARVDRSDLVGVLLQHDVALHLHRRRQLTVGLGEVPGKDTELLDRFRLRHRLVGLAHRLLQLVTHARPVAQLLRPPARGLALMLARGGQRVPVQGEQRVDERLPVADDQTLADQRVGPQLVLQDGRGDVLAAGRHDQLLLAPGDGQVPVVVELADVTGVEPALVVEDLRGGGRVVPVPAEHVVALDQDLAVLAGGFGVVGDADGHP